MAHRTIRVKTRLGSVVSTAVQMRVGAFTLQLDSVRGAAGRWPACVVTVPPIVGAGWPALVPHVAASTSRSDQRWLYMQSSEMTIHAGRDSARIEAVSSECIANKMATKDKWIGVAARLALVAFLCALPAPTARVLAADADLGPKDGRELPATDLERVKPGVRAPDFTLEDQNGRAVTLSSFQAHVPVVLVFYRGHW